VARSPRRVWRTWTAAATYVGASTRRLALLAGTSVLRGLAEAAVLVVVAKVAFALARGDDRVGTDLGPIDLDLSVGSALAWGGVLVVVMLGLRLLVAWMGSRMAADATAAFRERLADAFLDAAWGVQAEERQGRLQEVMTTYVRYVSTGVSEVATLVMALFNVIGLVVVAFLLAPVAAAVVLALVAVLALGWRPLVARRRRLSLENRNANTALATDVSELVSVARDIRTFHVGDAVSRRLSAATRDAAQATFRVLLLSRSAPDVYQSVVFGLALGGMAVLHAAGAGDTPIVGAVVLVLVRALGYTQQVQVAVGVLEEVGPYLDGAREQEERYRAARVVEGSHELRTVDAVELDAVSYQYEEGRPALHGITTSIAQGETVGVIGPSGSGKSTLVQILLRLREPDEGRLLVNGRPAGEYDLTSWARAVAAVSQSLRVVEASVAENVRFFREWIDDETVERAARQARVHDEIVSLPDGYDTVLGGLEGALSGGQIQRLCLARALAGDPSLIVLDEPASALDARSEDLVQGTLADLQGGVTLVIIAHRLTTLRLCDRVMVLEDGRLVAFDTPATLLESEGFYREAFDLSRV